MKVELNTKDKTVYVNANDVAEDIDTIDQWVKALQIARAWLRKELKK